MSDIGLAVGLLWALFFSCLTIAAALGLAWANFGHPRYALSWAIFFLLSAVQNLEIALAFALHEVRPLTLLAFALVMVPSPFFAMGARQRAGLPDRRYHYLGSGLVVLAILLIGSRFPALAPFAYPAGTVFSALVLMDAAIILRPRLPKAEAAEWALTVTVAAGAGVKLIVAILACIFLATGSPIGRAIYHGTIGIVAPPCVVAAGVSAILVVASDLAVQLRRIAARDPLTGLYNRRGFQDLAAQTIARAHANRQPITLVLCDIDHFKRINDDHGHMIGDQTLVHVGRRLSAGVRVDDLVGRIGGEEFALLVLDSRGYEAAQTMDRIRADIADGVHVGDTRVAVTVSFGIVEVGTDGTIESMLASAFDRADRALYRSKIGGRDRVTLAGTEETDARLATAGPDEF